MRQSTYLTAPEPAVSSRRQFLAAGVSLAAGATLPAWGAGEMPGAARAAARPLKKGIIGGAMDDLKGSVLEMMRVVAAWMDQMLRLPNEAREKTA